MTQKKPTFPRMTDPTRQGVCEVRSGHHPNPLERICDKPAVWRYPAMGGGYMRLCAEHGEKHRTYAAEWLGVRWSCGPWESPEAVAAVDPVEGIVTDRPRAHESLSSSSSSSAAPRIPQEQP